MNAREVASALSVNERTIRRAIADGRLNATKENGHYDVDLEEARAALRRAHRPIVYQEALAEALMLLRGLGNEADAEDLERRYDLLYIEPKPEVIRKPESRATEREDTAAREASD